MVDNPEAGAAGDVVLTTTVERGDQPHHLSGGEIEAEPHRVTRGAGDTGEREHQGHFLSREISQPVGGGRGGIFIITYFARNTSLLQKNVAQRFAGFFVQHFLCKLPIDKLRGVCYNGKTGRAGRARPARKNYTESNQKNE